MAGSFWRPSRVGLMLTALLALGGAGIAYLGTRDRIGLAAASAANVTPASGGPIVAITLSHMEPDLPSGPHRETFHVNCTVCHSTQLVLNQPPFPEKKWTETVHKMVQVYGAPIRPTEEAEIVEYLKSIRGK